MRQDLLFDRNLAGRQPAYRRRLDWLQTSFQRGQIRNAENTPSNGSEANKFRQMRPGGRTEFPRQRDLAEFIVETLKTSTLCLADRQHGRAEVGVGDVRRRQFRRIELGRQRRVRDTFDRHDPADKNSRRTCDHDAIDGRQRLGELDHRPRERLILDDRRRQRAPIDRTARPGDSP
jgi:hypothetical protein